MRRSEATAMKSKNAMMLVALCLVANFGCAQPQKSKVSPAVVKTLSADDRLRVDDVLEIRVVGESELSGEYRIDPDGKIQFPYVGSIQIAGLRVADVHDIVTARLKEEYLRNPQVAVHVKEWNSRKISVLGEVGKPGPIQFFTGMTIVDAIAAAGGFTKNAVKNAVKLRREIDGQVQNEECRVADIGEGIAPNVSILPGDLIVVDERLF
jgi:polysaccharide biosynthesis/export protein VpsN